MSPGLFQDFMDGYIKFKTFLIISWTVGRQLGVIPINGFPISGYITAGSKSGGPQFESYGYLIFHSCFMKFVFRISEGIKFWQPKFDYH